MNTKENRIAYTVESIDIDWKYKRLIIKVWINKDEFKFNADYCQPLKIAWQSDQRDFSNWYSGGIEETIHAQDQLALISKMFKKLFPSGYIDTPAGLINTLQTKNANYVIYDPRIDEYRLPDELYPADYSSWADDNEACGNDTRFTTILARDTDNAESIKERVNIAFIDFLSRYSGYGYTDSYKRWLNADQPINRLTSEYRTRKPDYRTIEEILSGK